MSINVDDRLKKIKLKRWELTKAIFEIVFLSMLSGGGHPLKPILPLMIDEIIKILKEKKGVDVEEKKIVRILNNMERRDIISIEKKEDSVLVHTVNNNHPIVIKYSIKTFLDFKKKEKKWNGKWFIVFFDVPEIQRNKRDYLREFLKNIGFYPYQKSVYLFPYECEKEITLIKKIIEGAKYMKYIIADKIEDENVAKIFFHLT